MLRIENECLIQEYVNGDGKQCCSIYPFEIIESMSNVEVMPVPVGFKYGRDEDGYPEGYVSSLTITVNDAGLINEHCNTNTFITHPGNTMKSLQVICNTFRQYVFDKVQQHKKNLKAILIEKGLHNPTDEIYE